MKAIKYILLLSLSLCKAIGQNVMTSSPYSMFGIGEISYGLNGGNAGMGGVSLGFREKNWLNMSNPAGLSAIDSCRMYAEVSAFAKLENYRSGGSFNQTFTGNFSGFALAGRMVPHWYAGIELKPYSSVGYYFQTEQEVEGAPGSYYTSLFTGNGGWSKFQLTNSILLHNLSLGVNIGFLFGKSENNETQSEISVSEELSGQAWSFDFGLQYTLQLQKELWLTFGALYSLTTDMEMNRTQSLSDSELKSNFRLSPYTIRETKTDRQPDYLRRHTRMACRYELLPERFQFIKHLEKDGLQTGGLLYFTLQPEDTRAHRFFLARNCRLRFPTPEWEVAHSNILRPCFVRNQSLRTKHGRSRRQLFDK